MLDFLTIGEAQNYASGGKGILADVRCEQDYFMGHLPGAINIPLDRILEGSFRTHPLLKDNARKIILYCDTGTASLIAARRLNREGFDACSISGGISDYKGRLDTGFLSQ